MGITTSWKSILIDTSVIIKVINYKKHKKEVNEFAYKLIDYLSSTNAQVNDKTTKKRQLFVSAISIAEIIDSTSSAADKTRKIVQALNASNLEIIDFDEDVADIYNIKFIDKLKVQYQKDILKKWGVDYNKVNKEILTKDLMILGCGIYKNVDAVLCFDKGMYRVGRECGINMVYVDPKFFDYNEIYIFEFFQKKCDKDMIKK